MDLEARIAQLQALIERDAAAEVVSLLSALAETEVTLLVERLPMDELISVQRWLPEELRAVVFAELDPAVAASVMRTLEEADAAEVLGAMPSDEAADIVGELEGEQAERILDRMEEADAAEVRVLATFPSDTAGGIMSPAFTAIDPDTTAGRAIAGIRQVAAIAPTFTYVYVTDPEDHLLGVLPLHKLLLSSEEARVRDLMIERVFTVPAMADRELAARTLADHNLLALPVVDEQGRLLGVISPEDLVDVLEAEATEDIERLGGSQPLESPYRFAPVSELFKRRIVWLLLLFLAEAYTGTVLRHFQGEEERVVALTWFLPLLTGTGGNVGSQTVSTLVRAMAMEDVKLADARWVMLKEVAVGATMGGVMAVVAFGRASILSAGSDVALVVAITILAICVWAATVAALLPLLLRWLRIDPAVVSSPLIATLVDGTGLVIYFTVAKLVLGL